MKSEELIRVVAESRLKNYDEELESVWSYIADAIEDRNTRALAVGLERIATIADRKHELNILLKNSEKRG